MIDTLLNIVVGYLALGTIMMPLILGIEYLRVQAKGAEFKRWLNGVLGESKSPLSGGKALLALLRWPMFLFFTIVAFFKGQTMLEYIAKSMERATEKAEKAQQHIVALLDNKIPLHRDWYQAPVPMGGTKWMIHFYRSIYMSEEVVPTHLVVEADGVFTAWRVISEDFGRNLPLGADASLKVAKRLCEQDDVWLAVSQPGMEAEKEAMWVTEHARFQDESELDRLALEVSGGKYDDVVLDDAYDTGKTIKTD